MFNKITTYLGNAITEVKNKLNALNKPIKAVIIAYFAIVAVLVLTAYCVWFFLFLQGKAVFNELLGLLKEMVSAPMVAFVTFIATCLVDSDGDGIPDKFEKEDDAKCENTFQKKNLNAGIAENCRRKE